MTASARLLETARRILEEAGRPLSVRRILRTAERDARFGGDAPSIEALGEALAAGAEGGVLVEQRRGVFSLADGAPSEAPAEAKAAAPASTDDATSTAADEERPRRRRRRRSQTPAETGPVAPPSLDGTAELSAGAEDRDALKGKLWSRLRQRASQITEQPLAVEPEPPKRRRTRGAESAAPTKAAEPVAEREAEAEAPEAPRRRRRRREAAEVDAAPTPQAAEAARTEPKDLARASRDDRDRRGTDLRATLKARLAGRSNEGASEAAESAKSESAKTESPKAKTKADGRSRRSRGDGAEAPSDAGDARDAVKSKLAARLRGRSSSAAAKPTERTSKAPAAPAKAPEPSAKTAEAQPGGVDLKARMRARLAARSGDAPAAASAPATPASASSAAVAPADSSARSVLKSRLAARLGVSLDEGDAAPAPAVPGIEGNIGARVGVADPAADTPAEPTSAAETVDPADLKARLKARIGRRGGSARPGAAPESAAAAESAAPTDGAGSTSADPTDLKARLKARIGRRGGDAPAAAKTSSATPDPLDRPLSESRRPYREARKEPVPSSDSERRAPVLAEVSRTSTLVSAAVAALRAAGATLSLDALAARVDATAEGGAGGLRAALIAENARRIQAGLRAPFVIHYGGEIGLTEWGLSARHRALEAQMQSAIAEQRELVRRDLLARVGDLSDAGFEQVVVLLLERLGHHAVEVVGRQAGTVALVVSRADEAGAEKIAVVARRSWSAINADTVRRVRDTLPHFEAESGLVLTVGTFSQTARREARLDGQTHVRLVDGAGLARLLHEHGIGLASHQPVLHYVDVGFFESLER